MFLRKTVFILGAGSNHEFGFYLNENLRSYCAKEFPENLGKTLRDRANYTDEQNNVLIAQATKLQEILNSNLHVSVDHLLSMHPRLETIGKLAIADAILHGEERASPFSVQDVYQKIFRIMTSDIFSQDKLPNLLNNKVTFITFNYDRSLEFFLQNQLHQFTDWSISPIPFEKVQAALLRVYHVYGSLGSLFEIDDDYLPYAAKTTLDNLVASSASIDVIYGAKTIRHQEEILSAIADAEGVFFLGFGYDTANLQILQIPAKLKDKTAVFGTGKGLSQAVRSSVNSTLKGHSEASNHFSVSVPLTHLSERLAFRDFIWREEAHHALFPYRYSTSSS